MEKRNKYLYCDSFGNPPNNSLEAKVPQSSFGQYKNALEITIKGQYHEENVYWEPTWMRPGIRRTIRALIARCAGAIYKKYRFWKYKHYTMSVRLSNQEFIQLLDNLNKIHKESQKLAEFS